MNYIIAVAAVACCYCLSIQTLDLEKVHSSKHLCSQCQEDQELGMQLTTQQIHLFALIITLAAAVTAWRLVQVVHDPINLLKTSFALVILTGCACVDAIEHRIPNFFSGILTLIAAALLAAGFLIGQEGALGYLRSSLFAAAVSAVCLTVGSVLSHQGIGIGDIKLVTALALMGGVVIVGGTIFFSMLLCALISAYLLVTKKKTMRESIPFGPFLLAGYMLSVCILNF